MNGSLSFIYSNGISSIIDFGIVKALCGRLTERPDFDTTVVAEPLVGSSAERFKLHRGAEIDLLVQNIPIDVNLTTCMYYSATAWFHQIASRCEIGRF